MTTNRINEIVTETLRKGGIEKFPSDGGSGFSSENSSMESNLRFPIWAYVCYTNLIKISKWFVRLIESKAILV
jgi:hypothetical protein